MATIKNSFNGAANHCAAGAAFVAKSNELLYALVNLESNEVASVRINAEDAPLYEGYKKSFNELLVVLKGVIALPNEADPKVNMAYEAIMAEVINSLKSYWEGQEMLLSFGALKHQMAQKARGLRSKASKERGASCAAYNKVANDLMDSKTVRKFLQLCGKLQSISANTFEVVGKGKFRIAYYI